VETKVESEPGDNQNNLKPFIESLLESLRLRSFKSLKEVSTNFKDRRATNRIVPNCSSMSGVVKFEETEERNMSVYPSFLQELLDLPSLKRYKIKFQIVDIRVELTEFRWSVTIGHQNFAASIYAGKGNARGV